MLHLISWTIRFQVRPILRIARKFSKHPAFEYLPTNSARFFQIPCIVPLFLLQKPFSVLSVLLMAKHHKSVWIYFFPFFTQLISVRQTHFSYICPVITLITLQIYGFIFCKSKFLRLIFQRIFCISCKWLIIKVIILQNFSPHEWNKK